jgi:hypothetical protein
MRLTLLEYVQSILSSLDSDEVNSISDNPEALQVAEIVRAAYFNIIGRTDLPQHKQLLQLEPSLDPTQPVLMSIPDGISKIEWIKYFNSSNSDQPQSNPGFIHDLNLDITGAGGTSVTVPPGYEDVTLLTVHEFINKMAGLNPANVNVGTFTFNDVSNNFPGNFTFYYLNDRQPQYCTVLSDWYVIFDAYNSTIDSTLQTTKTLCYGEVIPSFTMSDTFIPNIDERQVPLLLNEAKSLAFFELKQTLHTKAEQESKRQWSSVQRDKHRVDKPNDFEALPNFGRYGRSSHSGLSFFKTRGWDRP